MKASPYSKDEQDGLPRDPPQEQPHPHCGAPDLAFLKCLRSKYPAAKATMSTTIIVSSIVLSFFFYGLAGLETPASLTSRLGTSISPGAAPSALFAIHTASGLAVLRAKH
jgi:hypothetical protein